MLKQPRGYFPDFNDRVPSATSKAFPLHPLAPTDPCLTPAQALEHRTKSQGGGWKREREGGQGGGVA